MPVQIEYFNTNTYKILTEIDGFPTQNLQLTYKYLSIFWHSVDFPTLILQFAYSSGMYLLGATSSLTQGLVRLYTEIVYTLKSLRSKYLLTCFTWNTW